MSWNHRASWIGLALICAMACNNEAPKEQASTNEAPKDDPAAAKTDPPAVAAVTADDPASAKAPPFIGKWKLVAVTTASGPVPQSKLDQGGMSWTFDEGGRMVIEVSSGDQTKSSVGSWKLDGEMIHMDENGQKTDVKFERTERGLRLINHPKGTPKLDFEKVL